MTGLQFLANIGLSIIVIALTSWGLSFLPAIHVVLALLLYVVEIYVIFKTNVARQLGVN